MEIELRRLTPELAEDYVYFFDTTPHDDQVDEHKCYCICWCSADAEGKDFSTREQRRAYALQYVASGVLQGYLAYQGNKIVGWCNANTKADCLKCASWRRFMAHVPLDDLEQGVKVKSVFCFVIAPEMRRQGIAALLLEHVCREAAQEGFDVVEAYPWKQWDFGGYYEMYKNSGFTVVQETESGYVMRRQLKHPSQNGRV
ncbi:MAG TPA: GNAT family N-acetyltransferase [Limnochordia bacterium]|jgi:GNAT superfamily N-acetyltransferase|nr:GNAT family N-acetyltransferase [Bacillota bacterium]HOK32706.1 GNAT family N-acetyltransferase [Limnochordia bacterium]HAI52331.1 GNAT family N-acetyltransferase [Bacillota bacterium]HAN95474.1 GNAT family N-acetyltransferase [Bacillota bacterium]HBG09662.1 GNAT family N-acetyltransferase [Bacillota bacterium]